MHGHVPEKFKDKINGFHTELPTKLKDMYGVLQT
jgi:hypothetical protein